MYKIILVDDDTHTIEGMQRHIPFEALGLELVAVAYNGKDGLDAIEKYQPDIIFTDIQMPQMTGFEMIHCLQELPFTPQVIMFTGFNDFDNAKLAIAANVVAYLVKPTTPAEIMEALQTAISACEKQNRAQSAIKRQVAENLMHGYNYADEDLDSLKHDYSIDLKNKNFCCVHLSFCHTTVMENKSIIDLFANEFQTAYDVFTGNKSDNSVSFLLSSENTISPTHIKELAENVITNSKLDVFVAIGTVTNSTQTIAESYKKSCDIQKYGFCFNNKGCVTFDYITSLLENSKPNIQLPESKELYTSISFGNTQPLSEFISNTEKALKENIIYDPLKAKTHIYDFCNNVIDQMKNTNWPDDIKQNIWIEINALTSHNELFEYFKNIVLQLTAASLPKEAHSEEVTANIMLKYVEENYMNSISLVSLSRLLFCSRNHLREVFKKHVGADFKNYLQDFRMKKAGELLLSSRDNLLVVAENVGYHDMKTFRSVFFNHYGMLPSEYRQANAKKDQTDVPPPRNPNNTQNIVFIPQD